MLRLIVVNVPQRFLGITGVCWLLC